MRTTMSAGTIAWKQQVAGQLDDVERVNDEFLELVVAYGVGPRRSWRNLWKLTIDSLGAILGQGDRPWNPRDGQIVRLGLSVSVDQTVANDVVIDLRWRGTDSPADPGGPSASR